MSKKNVFVANSKVISMGKGNLQFNTSTESFRERMQMFADGINAMTEKRKYYNDCITTARRSLELYEKGTVVESHVVETKLAEIEQYKKAVADITAEIMSKMPEYNEADKNLFYAYRVYINGEENVYSGNTYKRAFMEWLDNAGIVPTEKGINFIMSQIGVNGASTTAIMKNGGETFTAHKSEKQYLQLVYKVVATMMYKAKALKKFEYTYVIEDKKATK